jgi:beta-galactosidase
MEELPFECDLTAAAVPGGPNQLAIRITNPGGFDWVDGNRLSWGGIEFQKSHGFGGIDRGMVVSAHGDMRATDSWALNTPTPRRIKTHAIVENKSSTGQTGVVRFYVGSGAEELNSDYRKARDDCGGQAIECGYIHRSGFRQVLGFGCTVRI